MSTAKSFEEAERQVANLVAAVGGNVDAYEEESRTPSVPSSPADTTFEAAKALVDNAIQHHDPTGRPRPVSVAQATKEMTGKDPGDLLRDMSDLSQQMGGLTGPVEPPEAPIPEGEDPSSEDEDLFASCATGTGFEELEPEALDPTPENLNPELYEFFNIVEESGTLHTIWQAFVAYCQTKQAQAANIGGRQLPMRIVKGVPRIDDHANEVSYKKEPYAERIRTAKAGDLFIWVEPIADAPVVEPIGYVHNGFVFRKK